MKNAKKVFKTQAPQTERKDKFKVSRSGSFKVHNNSCLLWKVCNTPDRIH